MRIFRASALCGVAAVSLLGLGGVAQARAPQGHVMSVTLPGGGVARITYWGNVAPRVTIAPVPLGAGWVALPPAAFGPSPFATLRAVNAEINHAMADMMREMRAAFAVPAWTLAPGALTPAALGTMPPGGAVYSMSARFSGDGVCSRSISVTYPGNGATPKVVRHSSGNCGAEAPSAGVTTAAPAATARQPGTILVSDESPAARTGAVTPRPAVYWQRVPSHTPARR